MPLRCLHELCGHLSHWCSWPCRQGKQGCAGCQIRAPCSKQPQKPRQHRPFQTGFCEGIGLCRSGSSCEHGQGHRRRPCENRFQGKPCACNRHRAARHAYLVGYDRSVPRLCQASHCTGAGQCVPHCPQRIDIPGELRRIDAYVEKLKQDRL